MQIERVEVLREFTLHRNAASLDDNRVFDAYGHAPDGTPVRFSRHIPDLYDGWRGTVVVQDDGKILGSGEDPRPFYWRDSLCFSSQAFYPGHDFINRVYIVNEDRWLTIALPKNMRPGKNWSPFVVDDELYFVHEFSPFVVVKATLVSERDGYLVLERVARHQIKVPISRDKYWMYRGGTRGLQIGRAIVGLGHTNEYTADRDDALFHHPFLWVYRPNESVGYYKFDFDFGETFRIIDPTSLYRVGDDLVFITSETEQAWHVADQKGRICRYRIRIEGGLSEESFDLGGRWLHRWPHDEPSKIRRFLGAWRRH